MQAILGEAGNPARRPTGIEQSGWLTKQGNFHPCDFPVFTEKKARNSHAEVARQKSLGGTVGEALLNGHLRIILDIEGLLVKDRRGLVVFNFWEANRDTCQLIFHALNRIPLDKVMHVAIHTYRPASYECMTLSELMSWLETKCL